MKKEVRTMGLRTYHVFHLFIEKDEDERNVKLLSHSQGDWDRIRSKQGLIWSIPTDIFDDPNFYLNYPDYEKWSAKDWWEWAVGQGYMPRELW